MMMVDGISNKLTVDYADEKSNVAVDFHCGSGMKEIYLSRLQGLQIVDVLYVSTVDISVLYVRQMVVVATLESSGGRAP